MLCRHTLLGKILLAFLAVAPCSVFAEYPDRPIRVIVHTKPGGGTDTMARLVWQHAGRLTGATFVVETHAGAGGQIGYTDLALAKPDGYSLGVITTMSIVTHQLTRPNVAYEFSKDFIPLGRVVRDPAVLAVHPENPIQSLEELSRVSLDRSYQWTWGGTFLWGAHHIHYEMFRRALGTEFRYIPFDAAAETRAALLGRHIDFASGGCSEFFALAGEGNVRILAVASAKRWLGLPDVPTYQELGYNLQLGSDRGFAVPAGTPKERVAFLSETITRVVQDPAFLAAAETAGIAPSIAYLPGEEFALHLRDLYEEVRILLDEEAMDSLETNPMLFPIVITAVALVQAVALLVSRRREPVSGNLFNPGTIVFFIMTALLYLILPVVGFLIGATVFLAASMLLLEGRRAWRLVPVAVMIPLFLELTFGYLLHVRLPQLLD